VIVAACVRRSPRLVAVFLAVAAGAVGAAASGLAWRSAESRLDAVFGASETRELEIVAQGTWRARAKPRRRTGAPRRDRGDRDDTPRSASASTSSMFRTTIGRESTICSVATP
jgi:hypothetical protein